MKVSKKTGQVRLEQNETRIGNFFVKNEAEAIKIQDLNTLFWLRVSKRMPVGIWLDNMLKLGADGETSVKTYIATLWSFFSVVPDMEFVNTAIEQTHACLNRHKDWYGIKESTEEGDEKAVEAVKEMKEFEGDLKKAVENAKGE